MATYVITSKNGTELGTYEGDTEAEAVEAMHWDAGYASTVDAAEALGKTPEELIGELEIMEGYDCAYCSAALCSAGVPAVDDEEAWEALADEHDTGCEWIATRAHRVFETASKVRVVKVERSTTVDTTGAVDADVAIGEYWYSVTLIPDARTGELDSWGPSLDHWLAFPNCPPSRELQGEIIAAVRAAAAKVGL